MEGGTSRFAEWQIDAREALRRAPATFLTILRGALTLALFVGGAYLIDQRSTYLGVFALSWSVLRVAASGRGAYARRAGPVILDSWIDLNCNARIELRLRMDNIIGHEAVRRLFDGLKQAGRLEDSARWEEWRDLLIETYRKRRAEESDDDATKTTVDERPIEHLFFEVRGGQVWKNGATYFKPCLYHEVLVPHDSLKSEWHPDHFGLYVRAFVVHGMLRLQVGRFGEVLSESNAVSRREWETVTSFPLLWCPSRHRLPLRLLLMDNLLNDSSFDERDRKYYRRLRRYHRQLARDARDYRLLASGDTGNYFREGRLEEKFYKRFSDWLRKDNFDQPLAHNDDYYSNDYNYYQNEYLGINLRVFDADSWSKSLSEFREPSP